MKKFERRVHQFVSDRISTTGPSGVKPRHEPAAETMEARWTPLGPAGALGGETVPVGSQYPMVSGRVTDLAVIADAGDRRVYVATANGGVWLSTDGGATWSPLMDGTDLDPGLDRTDSLACGALHVKAGATAAGDVVFVATGEGNDGNGYNGIGVLRGTPPDAGGGEWIWEGEPATPGLEGHTSFELAARPDLPGALVLASSRGLYLRDPDAGSWSRTEEGTFTSVVSIGDGRRARFYAARWGGRIFHSEDGREWAEVPDSPVQMTDDPRLDAPGRIGLAVGSSKVYALVSNAADGAPIGVFVLEPPSDIWSRLWYHPEDLFGSNPFQGEFDLAIAVRAGGQEALYLGGAALTYARSMENGAALYRSEINRDALVNRAIGATVHPDVHVLRSDPIDPDGLWVGCDGGVFHFEDTSGADPEAVSRNQGLATFLVSSLAQHPTDPELIAAGSQDNGCLIRSSKKEWTVTLPGDCGAVLVDPTDPNAILRSYWGADLRAGTIDWDAPDRGTFWFPASHAFPASNTASSYDASPRRSRRWTPTDDALTRFYAPVVCHPHTDRAGAPARIVAFGSCRPWISEDFGWTWYPIPTGDVILDDLGSPISALVFRDQDHLYAGTESGRVFRFTRLAAETWRVDRLDDRGSPAMRASTAVTSIVPMPGTEEAVFITVGGASVAVHAWWWGPEGSGPGWLSATGDIAGGKALPQSHHSCLVYDPRTHQLFAGTDIGVWRSHDGGDTWSPFSRGLPEAAVTDLALHPSGVLRAVCYGRGVFEIRL